MEKKGTVLSEKNSTRDGDTVSPHVKKHTFDLFRKSWVYLENFSCFIKKSTLWLGRWFFKDFRTSSLKKFLVGVLILVAKILVFIFAARIIEVKLNTKSVLPDLLVASLFHSGGQGSLDEMVKTMATPDSMLRPPALSQMRSGNSDSSIWQEEVLTSDFQRKKGNAGVKRKRLDDKELKKARRLLSETIAEFYTVNNHFRKPISDCFEFLLHNGLPDITKRHFDKKKGSLRKIYNEIVEAFEKAEKERRREKIIAARNRKQ